MEFFPLTSFKKDIRSHPRAIEVGQTSLPTEKDLILARTGHFRENGAWQYVQHTVPNLEYFGGLIENVRTLCKEIGRASQGGELVSQCAKK